MPCNKDLIDYTDALLGVVRRQAAKLREIGTLVDTTEAPVEQGN